ncbi:MAG: protein phosphatase 2C domain-containing protein, partial [Prosthecobacter sp.]|nr:protein phosphatase 2C domain-containing protein [Prosthecobacter sp.]
SNNEDAFLALTFDARDIQYLGKIGEASLAHGDFVFAVSDGMGGANSGEFASRIAVEQITKLLPRSYKLAAQHMEAGISDALEEIFGRVHEEMNRIGRCYEECSGMGATLTLACFTPGWMHFAHVGDSRIYYLPAGGAMKQITQDHSYVGWLRRQGKLNEREARVHPARNALNQALGAGHQELVPHLGAVRCQAGDQFLLCTDGITDGLWDQRLEEYLSAALGDIPKAFRIVAQAVAESGRDNCTAVVVEL